MQDTGRNLRETIMIGPLAGFAASESLSETEEEDTEDSGYTLDLDDYVRYVKKLSGIYDPYLFWGMITVSVFGCVILAYNTPHVGLACLGMLIVFPFALTQITAFHWYTARYFVGNYALHVIGFAVGVSWLLNVLCACGGACVKRCRAGVYWRAPASALRYSRMIGVLVIGVIPYHGAVEALQAYYEDRPLQDWRGAAEFIAQDLHPEDVLLFAEHRGSFLLVERGVDHYLRQIPGAPWPELPLQERIETEEDLARVMSSDRDAAKQLVTLKTSLEEYGEGFEETLKRAFSVYEEFGDVVVFADASSQHEVTSYEYIENELDAWSPEGKVELAPSKRTVSFEGREDQRAIVRVRFPERFEVPLSNSRFERWTEGIPSSWSFKGGEEQIVRGENEYTDSAIVRGDEAKAIVSKDVYFDVLHEGVTVEIEVSASVTEDVKAALYVRPSRGSEEAAIRKVMEPGQEEFRIEWPVREGLRQGGVQLGVEVGESEEGYVRLDDVKVYVDNPERRLTWFEQWTVAMDVKLEDVSPGEYPSRVFRSNISGVDQRGENYWIELHRSYGSRDWHRQSFLLEEGHTIPSGARNVTFRCGIWQGEGKAHIRDFRIVSGARPYRVSQ
ncbi:MAG: hypothetical protein ACLFU6_00410 [Candidatus Hydrogenedentota bacterium]